MDSFEFCSKYFSRQQESISKTIGHRYLAVRKDILQHCVNQSGYTMTVTLNGKDHIFNDYLISIQLPWSNVK